MIRWDKSMLPSSKFINIAINVTYSRECSYVLLFGKIGPKLSLERIMNGLYEYYFIGILVQRPFCLFENKKTQNFLNFKFYHFWVSFGGLRLQSLNITEVILQVVKILGHVILKSKKMNHNEDELESEWGWIRARIRMY